MKKILFRSPFILFFMGATLITIKTSGNNLPDSIPKGWRTGPNNPLDIVIGTDTMVRHIGKASGFVQRALALNPSTGNATMIQSIAADAFRNKRVRLTVYARSKEVETGAYFYFKVDGPDTELAFANTAVDLIEETIDWTLFHITLDVSEAAINMDFGVVMLPGQGTLWMDDFNLEVVDKSIPSDVWLARGKLSNPITKKNYQPNAKAMNLGFENK